MTAGASSSRTLAVRAHEVTRTFPGGVGVHSLSLEIESGTIFGFIGPSGSGKTTTVRLMTGVLAPDSGQLSVLGKQPHAFNRAERARLGYMPQLSVLYPELSLWENLGFCASLFGMPWRGRKQAMEQVLDLVELGDARRRRLVDASGGMQRRLALAATLIHEPHLLFLDEPTGGIDPVLRRKLWDHFASLRDRGRTLFVTTQYVGEAAYCDRVGVLAEGRVVTVDTPEGLRRQAFGGEVVDVTLSQPIGGADADDLARAAAAGRSERLRPDLIRLVVEDAGDVAPLLAKWGGERGIEVESVEQYLPPFDDVFVELVSRLSAREGQGEGGE
jgi:ABC-2 type transport system ATP-binding protein